MGSTCMLYFVAAVALCVRVRGAGANLNTDCEENSYFTLESNQSYNITIHLRKLSIQMNLKIPCVNSLFHRPAAHAATGQGEG